MNAKVDLKELQSGSLIGHFPCSSCGSNNNLAVYAKEDDEGNTFVDGTCFSPDCYHKFWTEEELREEGVLEEGFSIPKVKKVTKTAITKAEYKALIARTNHDTTMKDGSYYRGIRPDTAAFYGHLFERNSDGEIIRSYYPETKSTFKGELNSLRGYKTRDLPKQFGRHNIGIVGTSNDFSGAHKFTNGGKWLLIVAGEEDKLAAAQMLRDYQIQRKQEDYDRIAVVGIHCGEGTLAKVCANSYDFIDSFEEVILCMDSDRQGEAAVQDALKVLPDEKIKVMKTSLKDCSEMLQAGKQKQFISDFYSAKPLKPDGVKTSKQADDEIEEELGRPKIPLPPFMHRLQKVMAGGIPLGYMVNLGAQTGSGKTTIINEAIYYWLFNADVRVGILSLELTAGQYQTALLSRHIGFKINLIEDPKEAVAFVQQDWVQAKRKELKEDEYGQERYVLLDDRSGTLEGVKEQIIKLIKKYSVKMVVIDPIQDVLASASYAEQADFIKFLKQVIKDGVSVFNVCHITKGKTETDSEGNVKTRKLTEDDFSGLTDLIKSGGCNIVAMRNKSAKDEVVRNSTDVDVLKCRWTGYTGEAGSWYYDILTHTLYDKVDYIEKQRSNF